MKKLIIGFTVFFLLTACSKQETFELNAEFTELKNGTAYLFSFNEEGKYAAIDSVDFQNGKFSFSGSAASPVTAYIRIGTQNTNEFFLENTQINLSGHGDSLQNTKALGPANQEILSNLAIQLEPVQHELDQIIQRYRSAQSEGNQELMEQVIGEYQNRQEEMQEMIKTAAAENAANTAGAFLIYRRLRHFLSLDEKKQFADLFTGEGASSVYAQLLNNEIQILDNVAIGRIAPNFEMEDPQGSLISLDAFRGKYLMINFWASWCGPCRAKNPSVVKLYKDLGDFDFEILGVSLDRNREDWLKGIQDDNLTWPQVSDLQFWENSAAKLYGVSAIPHSVLLDKEGRIIGKNLDVEEIYQKVTDH